RRSRNSPPARTAEPPPPPGRPPQSDPGGPSRAASVRSHSFSRRTRCSDQVSGRRSTFDWVPPRSLLAMLALHGASITKTLVGIQLEPHYSSLLTNTSPTPFMSTPGPRRLVAEL